jgi:hypothetical protein
LKTLVVFLNELSFACSMAPEEMLPHVRSTLAAIRAAKKIRADIVVGPSSLAHVHLGDGTHSMAEVLRGDRDEWRFLLSLDQSSPQASYSHVMIPGQLEEVMFQGEAANGMHWARVNDSTIVSFAFPPNWGNSTVQAELRQLDGIGDLKTTAIAVPNLSLPEHVVTHRELIVRYGRELAKSSLIYEGDGFVVRIWFNDHPPPHFHVMLHRDTSEAVARYAIETLDLLSGKLRPPVRGTVEEWARSRRAELMSSWARCQNGQLPFRIEE